MNQELLNCWEIKKCERQKGGKKVNELGECIASKERMGHSCWVVAGMAKSKVHLHKRMVSVHPAKYIISIIAQEEN